MDESLSLARYVVNTGYGDLPSHVVEVQKKALLDAIAVMLAAGTLGEGCREFVELALETGGRPESTIIGFPDKVPAVFAAFANASMAHALDFEDAHDRALLHSNAVGVPAALAVAEARGGVSGPDLIAALTLGSDLACRMGLALKEDLLQHGWYMPPVLESFGATAAAGKLLGLSVEQILDAFSLNMCQATCSAELANSPQSQIRSVRDAFAAKGAVIAALLAKKGIKGFQQPLEGKMGFYAAYARGNYEPHQLTSELGKRFESAAISFKPWPSCRGTHSFVDAALQLINRDNLTAAEIEKVHVIVSPVNRMLCEPIEMKKKPATPINAKFSLPFVIATAFVYGSVTLDHFTQAALGNRKVLEMAQKVSYEVNWNLSKEQANLGTIRVFSAGEILTQTVIHAYGSPDNPISEQDMLGKVMSCIKYSLKPLSDQGIANLVELVLNIEKVGDIREIFDCLS